MRVLLRPLVNVNKDAPTCLDPLACWTDTSSNGSALVRALERPIFMRFVSVREGGQGIGLTELMNGPGRRVRHVCPLEGKAVVDRCIPKGGQGFHGHDIRHR